MVVTRTPVVARSLVIGSSWSAAFCGECGIPSRWRTRGLWGGEFGIVGTWPTSSSTAPTGESDYAGSAHGGFFGTSVTSRGTGGHGMPCAVPSCMPTRRRGPAVHVSSPVDIAGSATIPPSIVPLGIDESAASGIRPSSTSVKIPRPCRPLLPPRLRSRPR